MHDELLCEVRGRVITRDGEPRAGRKVEFLPTKWFFVRDKETFGALGADTVTKDDGTFVVTLTRTDLTGVQYLTRGAVGNYLIQLNGPGPHQISKLRKNGRKMQPQAHDS